MEIFLIELNFSSLDNINNIITLFSEIKLKNQSKTFNEK